MWKLVKHNRCTTNIWLTERNNRMSRREKENIHRRRVEVLICGKFMVFKPIHNVHTSTCNLCNDKIMDSVCECVSATCDLLMFPSEIGWRVLITDKISHLINVEDKQTHTLLRSAISLRFRNLPREFMVTTIWGIEVQMNAETEHIDRIHFHCLPFNYIVGVCALCERMRIVSVSLAVAVELIDRSGWCQRYWTTWDNGEWTQFSFSLIRLCSCLFATHFYSRVRRKKNGQN